MSDYEDTLKKIASFTLKTSISFIPIIGPILSSVYSEIEQEIGSSESKKITDKIIKKMKEDSSNLIITRKENLDFITKELGNSRNLTDLIEDEKYKTFNITERLILFSGKLRQENLTESSKLNERYSEDNKIIILDYIYDFVTECEEELWVEDDLLSILYYEISTFLYKLSKNNRKYALNFILKSMEETENENLRMYYFISSYFYIWKDRTAQLIHEARGVDTQNMIAEKYWKSILYSIQYIESNESIKKEENKTFIPLVYIRLGQDKDLIVNYLISSAVQILKFSPNHMNLLVDLADKFYDTYEVLGAESLKFAPSTREETKLYYDDLFGIKT